MMLARLALTASKLAALGAKLTKRRFADVEEPQF